MVRKARKARITKDVSAFLVLTGAVFRASALARVALKYPARANALHAADGVADARAAAAAAQFVADAEGLGVAASALAAAFTAADAAALASPFAAPLSAQASLVAAWAAWRTDFRKEIHFDASAAPGLGVHGLTDLRLWSQGSPDWAKDAWNNLKSWLPRDQGWDVWIDWYEDRLRGGSRGEAHELVFVSAPPDVWDKGSAAANAWIREHLPRGPEPLAPPDQSRLRPNFDLPFV